MTAWSKVQEYCRKGRRMRHVKATAWSVGSRLSVRELEGWPPPADTTPLTIPGREGGFAILFRFGAVCAVGLSEAEERQLMRQAAALAAEPRKAIAPEEVEIRVTPGKDEGIDAQGRFVVSELSLGRAQVIASVLAKSAVLGDYEAEVGAVFERIEPFATELRDGKSRSGGKKILRELGEVLLIQSRMVGRAEISDKPDITWDDPELDRLYEKLALDFELRDREQALTRKLELISRSANSCYDLMMGRRTLRVEWYIVFLILIEIVLLVYEMLARR
ncbi:MAG: RMD1 family protein [Deltaproteobacteria bacterium]|nr:RMD1 family protein [Deltaproteobacteria bacterium]